MRRSSRSSATCHARPVNPKAPKALAELKSAPPAAGAASLRDKREFSSSRQLVLSAAVRAKPFPTPAPNAKEMGGSSDRAGSSSVSRLASIPAPACAHPETVMAASVAAMRAISMSSFMSATTTYSSAMRTIFFAKSPSRSASRRWVVS